MPPNNSTPFPIYRYDPSFNSGTVNNYLGNLGLYHGICESLLLESRSNYSIRNQKPHCVLYRSREMLVCAVLYQKKKKESHSAVVVFLHHLKMFPILG